MSSSTIPHNLFNTHQSFTSANGKRGTLYSLPALEAAGIGKISRLPVSIRIVLEAVLRNYDDKKISEAHIRQLANWQPNVARTEEIPFVVARIAPGLALVHSPEDLYLRLESAEQAPLWVKHEPAIFKPLPSGARTIFVTEIPVAATPPSPKRWAELRRETRMTLHFPTGYDDLLEKFRKALVEARCSVEVDKAQRTITYAKRYEGQVAGVIEGLKDEYEIQVADLE